jgi:hypothetical protein
MDKNIYINKEEKDSDIHVSILNKSEEIAEQQFSEIGILSLRNDGIITFEPKEGKTTHTLEAMKVELDIFKKWAKNEKLSFISDNRSMKKFDADIRIYAQQNLPLFCNRFALIISSGISSFVTNIFIYMNRPEIPIKAFTNKEDAINWLKE